MAIKNQEDESEHCPGKFYEYIWP